MERKRSGLRICVKKENDRSYLFLVQQIRSKSWKGATHTEQENQIEATKKRAKEIESEANRTLLNSIKAAEAHHTVKHNLNNGLEWLKDPEAKTGKGSEAIHETINAGRQAANLLTGKAKAELDSLCSSVEDKMEKLEELRISGNGDSPEAKLLADEIKNDLQDKISKILDFGKYFLFRSHI